MRDPDRCNVYALWVPLVTHMTHVAQMAPASGTMIAKSLRLVSMESVETLVTSKVPVGPMPYVTLTNTKPDAHAHNASEEDLPSDADLIQ